jgi:hypothetical protein
LGLFRFPCLLARGFASGEESRNKLTAFAAFILELAIPGERLLYVARRPETAPFLHFFPRAE